MARKRTQIVQIRKEWCKGCEICTQLCPTHVLAINDDSKAYVAADEACTECGLCELRCPDLAIELVPRPAGPEEGQ